MPDSIERLTSQFFADCAQDYRLPNEENLRGWLWFTCPASLRIEVGTAIRANGRFVSRKKESAESARRAEK